MKNPLFIAMFILISTTLQAQNKDPWFAFYNNDSTMVGFADGKGNIKIKPKFWSEIASKFDDIIIAAERGTRKSYYLTKKGRIIGTNNTYYFDNTPDCESEGYIRFKDRKTEKIGLYNGNGDVAIPAIYNYLSPVKNGMLLALTDAHRYKGKEDEHAPVWEGGKYILVNVHNKVLISKFKDDEDINFFSLIISKQPVKSNIRENFKGIEGNYYSFINFDKEFRYWLKHSLLNDLTQSNLINVTHEEFRSWNEAKGWINGKANVFVSNNFNAIRSILLETNTSGSDYEIYNDDLNNLIYTSTKLKKYFNNCGEFKNWMYPQKSLVIDHKTSKGSVQYQFDFLRTNKGYKLISFTAPR